MIVFPDAEAVLVTYLGELVAVPVVTKAPNPRPDSFVRLSRVGGARRDFLHDSPMVVFECWAATETDASELGSLVRSLVFALRGGDAGDVPIGRVQEVGGLQSYPDPSTELPRYQFTASIDMKGRET